MQCALIVLYGDFYPKVQTQTLTLLFGIKGKHFIQRNYLPKG